MRASNHSLRWPLFTFFIFQRSIRYSPSVRPGYMSSPLHRRPLISTPLANVGMIAKYRDYAAFVSVRSDIGHSNIVFMAKSLKAD